MGDVLLALMRVAHGLAAALWLGVSVVGLLSPPALAAARAGGLSLGALAQGSMWALVVSGAVLMLDRLADPSVSTLYVALLGLKLALVLTMGLLALVPPLPDGVRPPAHGHHVRREQPPRRLLGRALGRRIEAWWERGERILARPRAWLTRARRERTLLALGLGAFVLGSLLTSAYEAVLRGF